MGITEATRLRKALSPEGFEEVDAELNSGELHFSKETGWGGPKYGAQSKRWNYGS
jgi:hypothetical protein